MIKIYYNDEEEDKKDEQYIYNDLQFKNKIINVVSRNIIGFEKIFVQDLILTNLNENDISQLRYCIEVINDFKMFNLGELGRELLVPNIFALVNTARARDGFERRALNSVERKEIANITQSSGSMWQKLKRGK